MSWIHLIALGAGVGIYAVGSLLFKVFTKKREATVLMLASERERKPKLTLVPHDAADRDAIWAPSTADLRELPEKLDQDTVRTPLAVTSVVIPGPPDEALPETPPKAIAELEAPEAPQEQTEADTSVEMLPDPAGISDSSLSPAKDERKKQWFLVRSSNGQVRVCQAWDPTPKTIAGPFATKDEATSAKANVQSS